MSKLYVDEIHPKTTGGTTSIIKPTSGSILQVQYTQIDANEQWTVNNLDDKKITSLAVNITPKFTNSIIKIEAMVNGEWSNTSSPYNSVWFFFRDNTKLASTTSGGSIHGILMGTADTYYNGDADSTPEHANYMYFDTPNTTSQITYTVGVKQQSGNTYWNLNRTANNNDERGMSLICVTEIAK